MLRLGIFAAIGQQDLLQRLQRVKEAGLPGGRDADLLLGNLYPVCLRIPFFHSGEHKPCCSLGLSQIRNVKFFFKKIGSLPAQLAQAQN